MSQPSTDAPTRDGGAASLSSSPSPEVASAATALRKRLERVRRRAWVMLLVQRIGLVTGAVIAALMVGVVLDYALRAPVWLRSAGLLGAAAMLLWALAALVRPAVRFRPSLTELALRVEHAEAGREAGLGGLLAAGLELGARATASGDRRLAASVVVAAAERAGRLDAARIMAPARTARTLGMLVIALGAAFAICAVEPNLARIGAQRLLWPWGGAEWPKRTGILDATGVRVHPLGSALALRAALTKHAGDLDAARVEARYRVIADGRAGAEQRVLLTSQDRTVSVGQGDGSIVPGALFERLIEPKAITPERVAAGSNLRLEYLLTSDDDETERGLITLVEPPAIVRATAVVTPPAYLTDPAGAGPAGATLIDLGTGTDERGAPAPILAGSRIALALEFNKPLPTPGSDRSERAGWLERALGADAARLVGGEEGGGVFHVEHGRWVLDWTLKETVRLHVRAVDEHGIAGVDEAVFRIDALADKPPTATVTAPAEDKSVLATALVDIAGEGRDDVGLESLAIQTRVARRPEGTEGGAPEPITPEKEWARVSGAPAQEGEGPARRLTAEHALDLSEIELLPGDEVWITALAADTYALGDERHEPVRSSVRRLRVLSREQLVEQVWSELTGVRRSAIKIDQDQEQARQGAQRPGADAARQAERAQSAISERIARQADAVRRVQQRLEENSLADPALNRVVAEAREALAAAGEQSVKAAADMGKAARQESAEGATPEAGKEERAEAEQAQQGVRDELGNLIEMLDQGEDSFASKRALERLLEQQKELRGRTAEAASQTAGKPVEQLTPEQRKELEEIAKEQRSAAEELRETVRKMQERERKLSSSDPAAAQAMAQAASRAEREQVAQKMDQAAQQAQKNQVGAAQQQQGAAQAALEQMLEDLEQAQNNRDEVLRRFLASLIESIEGLIQTQRVQMQGLGDGLRTGAFDGLDAGMAALHQNTLGVLDQAAEGPRELQGVTKPLMEAADAQAASVVSLRARPVAGEEAREQEQASLDRLMEAKEAAEKLDQQAEDRQNARKRGELRKQYEALLAEQVSIKDSTEGLVSQEQSRRTRAAARQLAQEQGALKAELAKIREATKELGDAKVFDFAHRRLDTLLAEAVGSLENGEANATVVRRQTAAARLLKSLVDALDERKHQQQQDFRNGQQQQQGAGGNSEPKLVPPAAEVALLRALQEEAKDITRAAGDAGERALADELEQAARLQRDVAEQARDLLERMKEEAQGGGRGPVEVPRPGGPGGEQGGGR